MFLQKSLRAGLVLLFCSGLASLSLAVVSTARSETAESQAIGPDARDALARMGKTLSAKQFSISPTRRRRFTVAPIGCRSA
jgi:hypothetical protein